MAKADCWTVTDAEARKRGEQTGLDTLVVHAVNYVPAAAVIRRWQALSGIIGRKARAGGFLSLM